MSLLTIGELRQVRHRAVHGWPARRGSSIRYHSFEIYGLKAKLPDSAGIYIVAKPDAGQWFPLLIGETFALATHLRDNPQLRTAIDQGATAVHIAQIRDYSQRQRIEQELVRSLQPPLNATAPIRALINRLGHWPH